MGVGIQRSTLLLVLITASIAHGHTGDEVYLFYELLDEDLDRIDLTDRSVEDWLEVVGEPSLFTSDFWKGSSDYPSDPRNLDLRVWLAWHRNSSTLWVAVEAYDDRYVGYLGDGTEEWGHCTWWDACMAFYVDGDHSGGRYRKFPGAEDESDLLNYRQAQMYWMPIDPQEGQFVRYPGAGDWQTSEPYAAGGGAVQGHSPATWVLEMKVTPFDGLVYNDEGLSRASELYPGKTIGFELWVYDADEEPPFVSASQYLLTALGLGIQIHADAFVDGLLVGAGADPSSYDDGSAVEPSSWGRIKAALE